MKRSQRWAAGTAVVVIVVVAAGWFTLISPQRSHAAELRSQAATQEQKNASLGAQIKTRTRQVKDVVAQQARVAAIAQQIPATISLASYVRMLTDAASKANVDLKSVAPGAPTLVTLAKLPSPPVAAPAPKASASPSATRAATAPPAAASAASSLSAVPVQLQVAGSYFQIQQFLANLQSLSRATDVTAVNLTPGGIGPTSSSSSSSSSAAPTAAAWQVLNGSISLDIFMTTAPLPALSAEAPSPSPSPSPSR